MARDGKGRFVAQLETAERRRLSAEMRSRGITLQAIANEHWNGDSGLAYRQIRQFWAEQPRETVEEIRSTMLAKLDALEQDVRAVMARRHYVVADGRLVLHPESGEYLIDDKPIYDGVAQVRALVETQLKLIPGLAAPKRMEVMTDDLIAAEIERARAELAAESDGTSAGDAGGTAESSEAAS